MDYSLIKLAKLEGGKVFIDQDGAWIECPDIKTQTTGEADSSGIVIIGAIGAVYFSVIQLDIAYLLHRMSDALAKMEEITRTQYIVTADNAGWGQIPDLMAIGDSIASIKTDVDEHKLI